MKNVVRHTPILSGAENSRIISLITDSFHKKILPLLATTNPVGDEEIETIIDEVSAFYDTTERGDIRKAWIYASLGLNLLAPHGPKLRAIKRAGEKILQ